jgi:glycosyltransferase involved in cell wall biosynthesis
MALASSKTPDPFEIGGGNPRAWPWGITAFDWPRTLPGGRPWPRICIVTPSFNQGRFIEQTILSVLNQGYPNLDYRIIDGGSTDDTPAVLDRYRGRIGTIVSEPDRGQGDAINKGFGQQGSSWGEGEILAWLNSDDMLAPGALAAVAMGFFTSQADIIAGLCTITQNDRPTHRHLAACCDGPLPLDRLLDLEADVHQGAFFYQPEVFFTRRIWETCGGRVDESLRYSMDYDLWLRYAEAGAKLHVVGCPLAIFRAHPDQKTSEFAEFQAEAATVRERFLERTKRQRPAPRPAPLRSNLRIVFFNDTGFSHGAGIAHQRLASAATLAGHDVTALAIAPQPGATSLTSEQIISAIAERSPDLLVVGNLHAAGLEPAFLGRAAQRWPTVQVLHDLYSLTGRCAYPGTCTRYLVGCDRDCPTPHEYPRLGGDLIRPAWDAKYRALRGEHAPIIAANSDWTAKFARDVFADAPAGAAAPRASPPIMQIALGLPHDVFKPRDRSTCRDLLGLPPDRFILLFCASQLGNPLKGMDDLIAALEMLDLPDLLAVCVGQSGFEPRGGGVEIRGLGYVPDAQTMAMVYSAADVYVGPSRVETFGQVFVEAAACGTPSIGYADAGGAPQAIGDGIGGVLAGEHRPRELAARIRQLYENPDQRRDLAIWGRLRAVNEFSLFASYRTLFAELDRIGLMARLGVPPRVRFVLDRCDPPAVRFLASPAETDAAGPATAAAVGSGVAYADAQSRLARTAAERDALRATLNQLTQMRIWRIMVAVQATGQRWLSSRWIPRFLRRWIGSMMQWATRRPGGL